MTAELASEAVLRALEDRARVVDVLDARARRDAGDPSKLAEVNAQRTQLLRELEAANVIVPEVGWRAKNPLVELGFARLVAYHTAAENLKAYYASPIYKRIVAQPVPADRLEGYVSLDWFRLPSGYEPPFYAFENSSWYGWLAECEHALRAAGTSSVTGTVVAHLQGAMHELWCRPELGAPPHLYRAVPA